MLAWVRQSGKYLRAIALFAMLLRALTPGGYMLAAAETPQGRYMVVQLCDHHADFAQIIDLDTGKTVDQAKLPKPQQNQAGKSTCVCATAAGVAPPACDAPVASTRVETAAVVLPLAPAGHLAPGARLIPWTTGPPARA